MLDIVKEVGSYAGLVAFLGLAILALLQFTQGRDLRRLREWAGSAPERVEVASEETSALAAERAEELRAIQEAREAEQRAAAKREQRRERRESGLPELTRTERVQERLPRGRYLVLIAVGVVLLAGGVAFAALRVFSDDGGSDAGRNGSAAALQARDIKVSVLNGTAVPGLASRFGDELEKDGFQLEAVTNTPSSFATSLVMYERGHRPEGRRVARPLNIRKLRPMTAEVAAVAGGPPVAVIIGEDRAASPPG